MHHPQSPTFLSPIPLFPRLSTFTLDSRLWTLDSHGVRMNNSGPGSTTSREILLVTTQTQQDVCCLMGMPVAGNPTQYMLEKAFEVGRVDWRFLTFEVSPRDFEGAMRGARIFGFRGILLAPPHRSTVLPYLDELSKAARLSRQAS